MSMSTTSYLLRFTRTVLYCDRTTRYSAYLIQREIAMKLRL